MSPSDTRANDPPTTPPPSFRGTPPQNSPISTTSSFHTAFTHHSAVPNIPQFFDAISSDIIAAQCTNTDPHAHYTTLHPFHPPTTNNPSEISSYGPPIIPNNPHATIHPHIPFPPSITVQSPIFTATIPNDHHIPSPPNTIDPTLLPDPHDTTTIPSHIMAAQCTHINLKAHSPTLHNVHPSTIAHQPSQRLPSNLKQIPIYPPATIHPHTQIPTQIIIKSPISSATIPNSHRNPSSSPNLATPIIPTPPHNTSIPSNIMAAQCTNACPNIPIPTITTCHPSFIEHIPSQISLHDNSSNTIHPPATLRPIPHLHSKIYIHSPPPTATIPNRHLHTTHTNITATPVIPTPHNTTTIPSFIMAAQCANNSPTTHPPPFHPSHPSTIAHKPSQSSPIDLNANTIHIPPTIRPNTQLPSQLIMNSHIPPPTIPHRRSNHSPSNISAPSFLPIPHYASTIPSNIMAAQCTNNSLNTHILPIHTSHPSNIDHTSSQLSTYTNTTNTSLPPATNHPNTRTPPHIVMPPHISTTTIPNRRPHTPSPNIHDPPSISTPYTTPTIIPHIMAAQCTNIRPITHHPPIHTSHPSTNAHKPSQIPPYDPNGTNSQPPATTHSNTQLPSCINIQSPITPTIIPIRQLNTSSSNIIAPPIVPAPQNDHTAPSNIMAAQRPNTIDTTLFPDPHDTTTIPSHTMVAQCTNIRPLAHIPPINASHPSTITHKPSQISTNDPHMTTAQPSATIHHNTHITPQILGHSTIPTHTIPNRHIHSSHTHPITTPGVPAPHDTSALPSNIMATCTFDSPHAQHPPIITTPPPDIAYVPSLMPTPCPITNPIHPATTHPNEMLHEPIPHSLLEADSPPPLSTPYGDIITLANSPTHVRFYGINIHGIAHDNKYAEGQHFVEAMKLLQVDVYGIQEVNLNLSCPHIQHDVLTTLKINDNQAKMQISTSPELYPNKYKPGGTITGVSGKLKGRIDKCGSDYLGRWSWITLEGKKLKKNHNHHCLPRLPR